MPDPLDYMARLCKVHLKEVSMDNYHIFINSVEGISRIIRLAGLTPDVCRVICSQSESSRRRNLEKLPEGFGIESTQNNVKRFNFYTSTCFEGQDIYDKDGRTFIVSERYKDHTKMDIRTSLPQICGRIRDSKYNLEINQFYSESPTKNVSLEEYKEAINTQFFAAEKDAEQFNTLQLSQEGSDFLFRHIEERPYLSVEGGKIVADRNLANREIVGYGIINGQFASMHNMNRALSDVGFNVTNNASIYKVDVDSSTTPTSVEKRTFKEVFEQYCQLKSGSNVFDISFTANRIEQDKPLVKTAYEILGPEKVRQLNYNQTSIKRELTKVSHQKLDTKIFMLLNEQLPKCVAIPRTEIKQRIEGIYKMLGSNQCAKATDIKKWYQVKETTKRGDDGKMIACFAIISAKYKVAKEKN